MAEGKAVKPADRWRPRDSAANVKRLPLVKDEMVCISAGKIMKTDEIHGFIQP